MTIDDEIGDAKMESSKNWEAAKVPVLSWRKSDKYEYLTGEEILSTPQSRMIAQAKVVHSPLENFFEKQIKN